MAEINISALPILMKFYMGSGTSIQMNIPHQGTVVISKREDSKNQTKKLYNLGR